MNTSASSDKTTNIVFVVASFLIIAAYIVFYVFYRL